MKKKVFTISILLSFALCYNSFAQLSIQIDSIQLTTINDYHQEYINGIIQNEEFESILGEGPHITVYGKLLNSSQDVIIYEASSEKAILFGPQIKTSFVYKKHKYETIYRCEWMSDIFSPVSNGSEYSKLFHVQVGKEMVRFYYIPGNTSIPIMFGSAFLYDTQWCKLKIPAYSPDNMEYNIMNNKRLEKIAREVLPTIKASIEVKTDWVTWSKLLVENSEVSK